MVKKKQIQPLKEDGKAKSKNKDNKNSEKDLKNKGKNSKEEKSGNNVDSKNSNSGNNNNNGKTNRQLVTSFASWTGKLPFTLLNEYNQKQKWNRINFIHRKLPDNTYTSFMILSYTPKNHPNEIKLEYKIPKSFDFVTSLESIVETKHIISTYVLHCLCFAKNIQMMLPPVHKDLWRKFEEKRKEFVDHRLYKTIYNPDPFSRHVENEQIKEKALKEKEKELEKRKLKKLEIEQQKEKGLYNEEDDKVTEVFKIGERKGNKYIWENAPFLEFNKLDRELLREIILKNLNWRNFDEDELYKNHNTENITQEEIVGKLLKFNFKKSHILQAIQMTSNADGKNSLETVLNWLVLNLNELDLPRTFQKSKNSKVQISNLGYLGKYNKFLEFCLDAGFEQLTIIRAYNKQLMQDQVNTEDDNHLENCFLKVLCELTKSLAKNNSDINVEDQEYFSFEDWANEIEGLKSIYPHYGFTNCSILTNSNKQILINLSPDIKLRLTYAQGYPNNILGIEILNSRLPKYLKLSIVQKILQNIYMGNFYIIDIIEFLNDNINKIKENPGELVLFFENTNVVKNKKNSKDDGSIAKKKKKVLLNYDKVSKKNLDLIQESYTARTNSSTWSKLISERGKLPAFKKKQDILNMILQNQITLITGETGSGKSTQILQFILDHLYEIGDYKSEIIMTEPRRISVLGLAERISYERNDEVGNEIGYVIKNDRKLDEKVNRVKIMTVGIFLKMIQNEDFGKLDNDLKFLIIDEVHERSVEIDFLIILIKLKILPSIPNLKIILMSATIDVNVFKKIFKFDTCHIEGRTFPIEDFYLEDVLKNLDFKIKKKDSYKRMRQREYLRSKELKRFEDDQDENDLEIEDFDDNYDENNDDDQNLVEEVLVRADSYYFEMGNINYDLILALVEKINLKTGCILIFLPGVNEIKMCINKVRNKLSASDTVILPLHSLLSSREQKKVFDIYGNKLKIVVSTNIAETSITIPDVKIVIDTGRVKNMHFEKNNSNKLVEEWCSKAEINQRRGRAGRIQNGICYRLFSKELMTHKLRDEPIPEILRSNLDAVYLSLKNMKFANVKEFFEHGINAIEADKLVKSRENLINIGAIKSRGEDEIADEVTSLGRFLNELPLELNNGKLLSMGIKFKLVKECLILCSIMSVGVHNLFINYYENKDKVLKNLENLMSGNDKPSDIIGMMRLVEEYFSLDKNDGCSKDRNSFVKLNYLSFNKMKEVKETLDQLKMILVNLKIPMESCEINDASRKKLLSMIVSMSFYPNIVKVQHPKTKYINSSSGAVKVETNGETSASFKEIRYFQKDIENKSNRVFVHPNSLFFKNLRMENKFASFTRLNYNVNNEKYFIDGLSGMSILDMILTSGGATNNGEGLRLHENGLIIDGWIFVRCWIKDAFLVYKLVQMVNEKWNDDVINWLIKMKEVV